MPRCPTYKIAVSKYSKSIVDILQLKHIQRKWEGGGGGGVGGFEPTTLLPSKVFEKEVKMKK